LFLPDLAKKIGITMMGTPNGPEPSEESFCRSVLTDLDGLFEKCREAFEKEYMSWTKKSFPSKWKDTFMLDGFSVPPHGNPGAAWDVCYYVEPANCYFTARFEAGRLQQVIQVIVDSEANKSFQWTSHTVWHR
jgi:hypothetical protein